MPGSSKLHKLANVFNASILLLAVFLLLPTAGPVQAQTAGSWTTPVKLNGQLTNTSVPEIAVDSQGKSHIVYLGIPPVNPVPTRAPTAAPTTTAQTSPGATPAPTPTPAQAKQYDLIYYQSLSPATAGNAGNASQPPVPSNIQAANYQGLPLISLAVDNKRGLLHMLFHSGNSIYYSFAPLEKAASAVAWSEPRNLDDYGNSYYSSIAVDSDGVIHAAWTQELSYADNSRDLFQKVVYRQSTDLGKTWSFPKYVATQTLAATKVTLRVDAGKGLYLTWDEGYDNLTNQFKPTYSAYSKSNDYGKTWSKPTLYGTAENPNVDTTMTLFQPSGIMIMWWNLTKQQLEYVVSTDAGGTWSAPAALTGLVRSSPTTTDRLTLAADGLGKVHLVAAGLLNATQPGSAATDPTQKVTLYHFTWANNAWSAPDDLGEISGYASFPGLAVGPNQLNLVWLSRTNPSEDSGKSVWYSSIRVDTGLTAKPVGQYAAPTAPPVVNTPEAGSTTATVAPILAPVTLPPGANQEEADRLWFDTGYSVAFISLVPVVALGVLLSLINWRRRRR